jgi:hypothetical protein
MLAHSLGTLSHKGRGKEREPGHDGVGIASTTPYPSACNSPGSA